MAGGGQPSMVTPRLVATVVGAACLIGLGWAVIQAGGTIPTGTGDVSAATNPLGLGLMALGALAFGAGVALRLHASAWRHGRRRRELTLDESEIRALLDRWYPDWDARHRARVASAISYHRQRMGSND